jgi:hypothetical protein
MNRRRSALGLAAVAVLVAAGGLAFSLVHHPAAVAPPSSTSPGPASGPIIGLGFSIAYDDATNQVLVFGGLNSADDTWLWDGRWTRPNPGLSPAGRSGAAAAYDPATGTVMLFGGSLAPGKSADDTWAWDGVTWHELDSGVHGPPSGQGAQMAWDSATNQMVLVTEAEQSSGAETWTWDGSHWTRQAHGDLTVSVFGDVMAYDPTTQTVLLVSIATPDNGTSIALSWGGVSWQLLNRDGPSIEGMAVNPQIHALLGCGIATYDPSLLVQNSCWEWTGFNWVPLEQSVPPPDSKQVIVEREITDVGGARVLMFGWLIRAIPGQPQPLHVWSWDGKVWLLLE